MSGIERRTALKSILGVLLAPLAPLEVLLAIPRPVIYVPDPDNAGRLRPAPWIVRRAPWREFLEWCPESCEVRECRYCPYPRHEPSCEFCYDGWIDVFWGREAAGHPDPWGFDWYLDDEGAERCPRCAWRLDPETMDREFPLV